MAIDVKSIYCEVNYIEDGIARAHAHTVEGDDAKALSNILNGKDILTVDWAAEAADVHQCLSAIQLILECFEGQPVKNLAESMLKELDKLRAIPGVGAELERRAAGREATAVPGSGRSQRNLSVSRRK